MKKNVVIAGTIRADVGLPTGIQLLLEGKSAIDAVEETIKLVEDNEEDWTVGTGGLPNLLGEVELDASIMDGRTLRAGAVAAIKHYKNPISIARKIMEETPHVLLVGEGADQFAEVMGFEKAELLTESVRDIHKDFLEGKGIVQKSYDTEETMANKERYFKSFQSMVKDFKLMEWYKRYAQSNHGTVNILAKDAQGDICCGVSTSGLSFKFPGRAGDSPIIGAGNYADNRYGAAACVGIGEIVIRLSLARIAVYELSKGATVEEAAINAVKSMKDLEPDKGSVSILVMDKDGNVAAACNWEDYHYWIASSDKAVPEKRDCIFVNLDLVEKDGMGYHR
ncbi:MAG TPA: N(4)-(beta-N-acetylglucosaminyl)-L-asparaginase [candidate division Zixibacteria bacterium]|nr:N(4)-(beta-N-acetylglucosaminyl)-L-asparaginase [candidate division Zixibacteria bacterium]